MNVERLSFTKARGFVARPLKSHTLTEAQIEALYPVTKVCLVITKIIGNGGESITTFVSRGGLASSISSYERCVPGSILGVAIVPGELGSRLQVL